MSDLDPRWSAAVRSAGRVPVDVDRDWARVQARAADGIGRSAASGVAGRPFRIPPRRQALAAAAVVVLLAGLFAVTTLGRDGPADRLDLDVTTSVSSDPGPTLADVVVPDPAVDWTISVEADPAEGARHDEACVEVAIGGTELGSGRMCGPTLADGPATSACTATTEQLQDAYGVGSCVWTAVLPRGAVPVAETRRPGRPTGPADDLAQVPGVRVDDVLVGDRPLTAYSLVLRGSGMESGMDRDGLVVSQGEPTVGPAVAEVVVADVPVDWTVTLDPDDTGLPQHEGDWCLRIDGPGDGGRFCASPEWFVDGGGAGPTKVVWARTEDGALGSSLIATVLFHEGRTATARAAFRPGDPLGPPVDLASVPGVQVSHHDIEGQGFTALSMVIPGAGPDEDGEPQAAVLEVTLV